DLFGFHHGTKLGNVGVWQSPFRPMVRWMAPNGPRVPPIRGCWPPPKIKSGPTPRQGPLQGIKGKGSFPLLPVFALIAFPEFGLVGLQGNIPSIDKGFG